MRSISSRAGRARRRIKGWGQNSASIGAGDAANTVPTPDLLVQVLPADRHLFAIRRANMRRKFSLSVNFKPVRSKQYQARKLACC